jgi:hypothetical protein
MQDTPHTIRRRTSLALGLALPFASHPVFASESPAVAGRVKVTAGPAWVLKPGQGQLAAEPGQAVHEGDMLLTGPEGDLHLVMEDGAYMAIRAGARVRITRYNVRAQADDRTWIDLVKGGLRMISGWVGKANPHAFRLSTPVATIGIRGTDFEVQHLAPDEAPTPDEAGTQHLVYEGTTVLSTEADDVEVAQGQAAYATSGDAAPRLYDEVPPFMRRKRHRFDAEIQEHIANLRDIITAKLQEKDLLNAGETLQQRLERFRQENPESTLTDREVVLRALRRAARRSGNTSSTGNTRNSGRNSGGGRR